MLSNGTRLLTLTGPGGTGKTRLALQVAAELVGSLHDGVFWVSLAGLTDPELLASEVAQTIGAPDDLHGFLRGRELLLLLDNFEHLLDAAPAVSAVLGACARGARARHEPGAAPRRGRAGVPARAAPEKQAATRSSPSAPGRSARGRCPTRPWRRSAAASTVSRSPSSSPRPGRSCLRPSGSSSGSTPRSPS